jgi:MFS transporter, PAT family, beta-lactamase induction signal transducer AmpG
MTNIDARRSLPAISEYRTLRLFTVFILYVAQGAPIGVFFFAIPAWLAMDGASPLAIGGFLSATSLPWTLKFVNGFIMDRFTFLPMGRRRVWLIGAQSVMVAGLILLALIKPGAAEIATLSAFSFLIMAATTFQDVAIDGMAVDLVPDDERARANGLMFGGQSIGIAAGTAFSGFAIAAIGFSGAMLGNAAFVGVVLMIMVVFRERPGERLLPWTPGAASPISAARQAGTWWPLIKAVWRAMITRDTGLLALAQVASGLIYGFYIAVMPLIAVNIGGWTDTQFSTLSGSANLLAGVLGVLVFGIVADKLGSRQATIIGFGLIGAAVALYLVAQPAWGTAIMVQAGAIGFLSLYMLAQVAICASAMKVCSLKVAATQFTLFMAISNLGITLSSAALGPVTSLGGYPAILAIMIVVAGIGAGAMYLFDEDKLKQHVLDEIDVAPAAF